MGAIRGDVERVAGQPVIGEGVVERTLAAAVPVGVNADDFAGVVCLVRTAILDGKAWHDLDVLGRIAADLRQILQLLRLQRKRLLG